MYQNSYGYNENNMETGYNSNQNMPPQHHQHIPTPDPRAPLPVQAYSHPLPEPRASLPSQSQGFSSYSIYGSNAALCFNLTEKDGRKTINVDAAPILGGQRRFDWQNKIALLVTESELPFLLAVLYGWLPEFEGKFHGQQKNKSFKVVNQQGKIFFSLSLAGKSFGVPIGGADAFYLLAKIMGHISSDYPGVSISDLSFMLQATTVRLSI